jgi:type IV pilus secretin PilQ/predicted competence protein
MALAWPLPAGAAKGGDPSLLAPPGFFNGSSEVSEEAGGPALPADPGQVWKLPSEGKGSRLDVLELKDMDINDVFKLLSARTGLNIVAGKTIQGRVTMFLRDVDARDALSIILSSNGLAYEEKRGMLEIMTAQEYEEKHGFKFGVDMNTEVFDISYGKAEDVVKSILSMSTRDLGHIEFDEVTNKIIVTDTLPRLAAMRRVIASMDRKPKEVLIEARIIQVVLKDGFSMGINWSLLLSHTDKVRARTDNDFGLGASVSPKSITTIGTLGSQDYQVILDMIESMGTTRVLSSPRVAVINNQEAKILIGSTKPYVTTSLTTPSSGPTTTAETVNFIDVGVKLNVTPTIHDDGYVTMKIKPEVSSAVDKVTTAQKNEIPIVETSQVDTTVRVKDGITIIIGGLIKDEALEKKNGIPFLGSIPVVGRAFRNEQRSTEKTEIVIFLTPHVISGDIRAEHDQLPLIKGDKPF